MPALGYEWEGGEGGGRREGWDGVDSARHVFLVSEMRWVVHVRTEKEEAEAAGGRGVGVGVGCRQPAAKAVLPLRLLRVMLLLHCRRRCPV